MDGNPLCAAWRGGDGGEEAGEGTWQLREVNFVPFWCQQGLGLWGKSPLWQGRPC